jgi:DNA end-binding protein Ku
MAPRANWKGFLRLSLVTCPVALFPATSESDKIRFNQINKNTGHRIKYAKVDAETGEEVEREDIVKGYKVDTDTYVQVSDDELDNIALESAHTIDIDEFVPRDEIDNRFLIRPYYIVPDGKVGHDAYTVIRETIRSMKMMALGRIVLTNREHVIALEPLETLWRKDQGAEHIPRQRQRHQPDGCVAREPERQCQIRAPSSASGPSRDQEADPFKGARPEGKLKRLAA